MKTLLKWNQSAVYMIIAGLSKRFIRVADHDHSMIIAGLSKRFIRVAGVAMQKRRGRPHKTF